MYWNGLNVVITIEEIAATKLTSDQFNYLNKSGWTTVSGDSIIVR